MARQLRSQRQADPDAKRGTGAPKPQQSAKSSTQKPATENRKQIKNPKTKQESKKINSPSTSAEPASESSERLSLSPTRSEGPDIVHPTEPEVSEALIAARCSALGRACGFQNKGVLCYRNSMLVMLLHSRRLMQWIRNRYIVEIDSSGVRRVPYWEWPKKAQESLHIPTNNTAKLLKNFQYTDIFCELYELSYVYWNNPAQNTADLAMETFWKYFQLLIKQVDNDHWDPKIQQDVDDLMRTMFQANNKHLMRFFTPISATNLRTKSGPRLAPVEKTKLSKLRKMSINEIIAMGKTRRRNCAYCDPGTDVKHRLKELEEDCVWTVSALLPAKGASKGTFRGYVSLRECLQKDLKNDTPDAICEDCENRLKKLKLEYYATTNANDAGWEKRKSEMKKIKAYIWLHISRLPEVLFIALNRIPSLGTGGLSSTKEKVEVDIPEILDLASFLEYRVAKPKETKYRLVGIVNHKGTRDQGHYIAQTLTDGLWTQFDDDKVTTTSLEKIIKAQNGRASNAWTPYVLMYEKIPLGDEESISRAKKGTLRRGEEKEGTANDQDNTDDDDDDSSHGFSVAITAVPGNNQAHLKVTARLGDMKIKYPTYVVHNYSIRDATLGEIALSVKDSDQQGGLLSAKALLHSGGNRKRTSEQLATRTGDPGPTPKRQKPNDLPTTQQSDNAEKREGRSASAQPTAHANQQPEKPNPRPAPRKLLGLGDALAAESAKKKKNAAENAAKNAGANGDGLSYLFEGSPSPRGSVNNSVLLQERPLEAAASNTPLGTKKDGSESVRGAAAPRASLPPSRNPMPAGLAGTKRPAPQAGRPSRRAKSH